MAVALGSVLLWLLNLAGAALIAGRRRAGRLVALAAQIPWTWHDLRARQPGFLLADAHLRAGVRARVADSAEPGPPAVRRGWWLAGRGNGWHPRQRGDAHPGPAGRLRAVRWLSCPAPAFPSPAARWIHLLLGLNRRSTRASRWDAGQP